MSNTVQNKMKRRQFLIASGISALTPAFASLLQYGKAFAQQDNLRTQFVGTWNLLTTELQGSDGSKKPLLPVGTTGVIMYDANGRMAVQIMIPNRPKFVVADQTKGTADENKMAISTYFAYFGDYEIFPDEGKVIHHTKGDILPNFVGEDQVRFYHFDKDFLYLSTPPVKVGDVTTKGVLQWQKDTGVSTDIATAAATQAK